MKNSQKSRNKIKIEINEQFEKALNLIESSPKNVFITGRAGTGKSTLLEYFKGTTNKNIAILAPTGVAALNVKGQTIHSFFKFRPDVIIGKIIKASKNDSDIYKKLDLIVIDEISMVRSDLLDCVDKFLRLNGKNSKKPFGGIQMVFIGDLYQLPPVVTYQEKEIFKTKYESQYFFDAKVFDNFEIEFVELEKIYRQSDNTFISLLNAIRNKSITDDDLTTLNERLDPCFKEHKKDFYIHLTTTNKMAEILNNQKLKQSNAKLYTFLGTINGDFDKKYLPTNVDLDLKIGSQVMFLNNDSSGRWVNGSIGKVLGIQKDKNNECVVDDDEQTNAITTLLPEGRIVKITPYKWKIFKYVYNKDSKSLDSETVGSFTQFPVKLAWAVTIHKSQGKTFDKVIIDIGSGTFAHGQVYVALSRCTSLEGIVLKKPIAKKHIFMDFKVAKFLTQYQYDKAEEKCSVEDKVKIIANAISKNTSLDIIYLKANDTKSERKIFPISVGKMEYLGKAFLGLRAFCQSRQEDRTFRIDRILEIK